MTDARKLNVNGTVCDVIAPGTRRLSSILRDQLKLTGLKIGCSTGNCGNCTVLLDGHPVCSCLLAIGQLDQSMKIVTIEGLSQATRFGERLQEAFHSLGAVQCGACTPAMVLCAAALLEINQTPDDVSIKHALAGVLCRCTGYTKIIAAVELVANGLDCPEPSNQGGVGARIPRVDGQAKLTGKELFTADSIPDDALFLRVIRSPFDRAEFRIGDTQEFLRRNPQVVKVISAEHVPGRNLHGVLAEFADQPVFASRETRFKGEAIAAIVGERDAILSLDASSFPVEWAPLPAYLGIDEALSGEDLLHPCRPGNVLVEGRVARGDFLSDQLEKDTISVEGSFETGFVEHAYLETEAAYAERYGDVLEITTGTQAPFAARDSIAAILGIPVEDVRLIAAPVGGGFGSKLDLSAQPFVAIAAWILDRPVAMIYSRPESMLTTTKRHPARMRSRIFARPSGQIEAMEFHADFNTGAYASWGPTVANRVPIHASGPYYIPAYRAEARAIHTHCVPAGAFRGFGVPQMAIAQEQLLDELAERLGIDPLEFRLINAIDGKKPTVTGQVLGGNVAFASCLKELRPLWYKARAYAEVLNGESGSTIKRGVGMAGMWYGCGNTSLPNPSTIRIGLKKNGRFSLYQGAIDIGQGSNTVITQIVADALGISIDLIDIISPRTDVTSDCGKTSASRQTFITGNAALMAAKALRRELCRLANADASAEVTLEGEGLRVISNGVESVVPLSSICCDTDPYLIVREASYNPPTTVLDTHGFGSPYAVYGFGAQMAEVEVDPLLGLVKVKKITAVHDVGKAINPMLVEGQIEGAIVQGLGFALMEEFEPSRTSNFGSYAIPTILDVPEIKVILVEEGSSVGPHGAKGIGEHALIPTAPAILNAIRHATGIVLTRVPATPDRIYEALLQK